MPKITNMSSAIVDAQAAVFGEMLNGGYIDFYSGTMPETADEPVTNQVRGATLRFSDPAFGPPAAGIVIARPIEAAICEASITARWARLSTRDRIAVQDVNIGVNDEAMIVPGAQLVPGCTLSIGFYAHTVARSEAGSTDCVGEFSEGND